MTLALIRLHTILAGFFFPAALVFAITGGLYTFGNKGEYVSDNRSFSLELPITPDLDELKAQATRVISEEFKRDLPTGSVSMRKLGGAWQFEWTGSRADFTLESTSTPGEYKASYKATTWHRYFVQLHKAKGGTPFKIMAGGLAIALISLFASGVAISLGRPQLRRLLTISFVGGLAAFVALASLS